VRAWRFRALAGPNKAIRHEHSQKPQRDRAREPNADSKERQQIVHLGHGAFSQASILL